MQNTQELAITKQIDKAIQNIPKITTIRDAQKWRSMAQGYVLATTKEYRTAENIPDAKEDKEINYQAASKAGEFQLLLEARLGELIQQEQDAGRLASPGDNQHSGGSNNVVTTLKSYGLTKMESSRAKEVNEHKDLIAGVIEQARKAKDPPTRQSFSRKVKEQKREDKLQENVELVANAPVIPDGRFTTILIDPPWDWGDEGDVNQLGRATPLYVTWPIEKLIGLPVADKAEDNSHLYLCSTNRSLPKAFRLLEHWGFRYITLLTWCKPSYGMGNYYRGQTEHVLFGVKGSCELLRRDVGTWFMGERGEMQSSKPEELYKIIESCSPGPWLEMFGRKKRPGWEVWGAEAK